MGELVKFNFGQVEITTIVDKGGEPWFVAKEVCDVLGLGNVGQAVTSLDDDEKNTITINDGIPGNPNRLIINEPGLYGLVLRSRKPEAKAFKRWVKHEVLPKIRKTGYYGKDPMELLKDPVAMRTMLLTYSEKIIELQPKADGFDRIADAEGSLNVSEAAKALQVAVMWLFKFLSLNRWIFRRHGGAYWLGYSDKVQQGLLTHKATTVTRSDGTEKVTEQVRVTPKGLAKLALIMNGGENV